jgi:hypothetical protein
VKAACAAFEQRTWGASGPTSAAHPPLSKSENADDANSRF